MSSRYLMVAAAAALAGTLAACESPKPAPPAHPANVSSAGSVDHQQRDVENRIDEALRSGRISRDEHRVLKSRADDIRREERRFMADGSLSYDERRALLSRLEGLSREVDRYADRR